MRKKERKENGEKREEVEVEVRGRGSRSKSTGEKTLTTTSFRGRSMEGHRFVTLPAPADASARIIPCPIPWVDPVTRATRPARDIEAEGEWQRERERGRESERKQRESRRNREREGERGRERERERERKAKTFKAREKMTFERALDLSSSLNILKNPRPNPLVVLFCVTSSACFTMTIRSHSDAGTIAEIPHYGIR